MQRRYVIPLAAIIAAALVLATGKISSPSRPASTSTSAPSPSAPSGERPGVVFAAPEFLLMDQDNRPVSLRDLRGKAWVADFMFTGCAGSCPVLSENMSRLQRQLQDPRMRFVSFDVDPDHDTLAMLKGYGTKYRADFHRWHFLGLPSRAAAFSLARAMHATAQTDDRDFQLLHSDNFWLVDAEGKVRGIYDSNKLEAIERLRADAAALLAK
jgi:protein SCO1/2